MDRYYQKLNRFSLLNTHFAFLDTEDYLADGLFIKQQVRVYFGDELAKPDIPYRVIFCHVRKWDEKRFQAAMEELSNKMLLCGHTDYFGGCSDTWEKAAKTGDERRNSRGVSGVTEQAQ